jgi:hypothetical protein
MAANALRNLRGPLTRGTALVAGSNALLLRTKQQVPSLLRQFAAEAEAAKVPISGAGGNKGGGGGGSKVGLYALLAAVGAGGGYYAYVKSGGNPEALLATKDKKVDYQKVCAFL